MNRIGRSTAYAMLVIVVLLLICSFLDNAMAESFMKTMKVGAVYPMAYDTLEDVVEASAAHRRDVQQTSVAFSSRLSQPATIRGQQRVKSAA